jgi:hypothetical protein
MLRLNKRRPSARSAKDFALSELRMSMEKDGDTTFLRVQARKLKVKTIYVTFRQQSHCPTLFILS